MVGVHADGRAVVHRAEGLRLSSVMVGEGASARRAAPNRYRDDGSVISRGASESCSRRAVCELGQNEYVRGGGRRDV